MGFGVQMRVRTMNCEEAHGMIWGGLVCIFLLLRDTPNKRAICMEKQHIYNKRTNECHRLRAILPW
jgi:hypothetical protein